MLFRLSGACLALGLTLLAAPKGPVQSHGANEAVALDATLYLGKDAVKQVLGSDLDGYYVVVEVRLTPKSKLDVHLDDFLLRTDKDGDKSAPFVASQIAGKGVLVVSETAGGGGMMGENQGPVWGGYPGGPLGRMPGQGGTLGTAAGGSGAEGTLNSNTRTKESPLMKVLNDKILREKETDQPISGLLYFPFDIKQKAKDLELIYKTAAGKLSLRFR